MTSVEQSPTPDSLRGHGMNLQTPDYRAWAEACCVKYEDGNLTGPFSPLLSDDIPAKKAGLNDVLSGTVMFVNGIRTGLAGHIVAAKRLAVEKQQPVVGVYNQSSGVLPDLFQCLTDYSDDAIPNPATGTLLKVIQRHSRGLSIVAHSQGTLIAAEALRKAKRARVTLNSGLKVEALANVSPTWPKGPAYDFFDYDNDPVSTFAPAALLGIGRLTTAQRLIGLADGDEVSAVSRTKWLHHRGPDFAHNFENDDDTQSYLSDLKKFDRLKQPTALQKAAFMAGSIETSSVETVRFTGLSLLGVAEKNREWIGDTLNEASDDFSVLSAATGVLAAGLALTAAGLALTVFGLPAAAALGAAVVPLGTASAAFAMASAASHAWYSTALAVGSLDGSVPVSTARDEMWGAVKDTALAGLGSGFGKVDSLGDTALGMAEGKSAVSVAKSSGGKVSDEIANRKTLGSLNKLTLALKKISSLPLNKLVKDAALVTRLKWLTTALKAVDFVDSILTLITAPLSAAANTGAAVGTFAVGKGKEAAQWGLHKAQQAGSLAYNVGAKSASVIGSILGGLTQGHRLSLHLKALPGHTAGTDGAENAARTHEKNVVFSTRTARAEHAPSANARVRKVQYRSVMAAARSAGDSHPEVTAAQWALESGWGKSQSGKNNFFGIKAAGGTGTLVPTHEVVGGKTLAVKARFADYDSFDAGIAAHAQLLSGKHYSQAGYSAAKTPQAAVAALVKGHYATDPQYADKMIPLIRRYAPETMTQAVASAAPGAVLQRKGNGDHPDVDPAALRSDLRRQSSGFVPDSALRSRLSGHLGFDPGGARLHTGPAAAQASRTLNAEAFTLGSDIFFGAGRFDPHTPAGLGLIAHEMTHVGQQTGTTGSRARFFTAVGGDDMEREAQQAGARVLANAGRRSGLFVEDYVREYEGHLSLSDQQRLDRISLKALEEAKWMLERKGLQGLSAEALDIEIEIDLGRMSDAEAARTWAEAILSSVEASESLGAQATPLHSKGEVGGLQRSKTHHHRVHQSSAHSSESPQLPLATPAAVPVVPMRNFVLNGKSHLVTDEEYQQLVTEANRRLSIRLGLVESGAEDGKKIQAGFMKDTHEGLSGLFATTSDWMGHVKPPAPGIWDWPKPFVAAGREAIQGQDLKKAATDLNNASMKLAQAQGQWHEYIHGTISGGETGIAVATVVRDTSFSIAVGTAAIVVAPLAAGALATAGVGTAGAAAITTAGVTAGGGAMGAALHGGSEALGEAASGTLDRHKILHETWDGAKHGAVDAATSVIGMGIGRLGARLIRPGMVTFGSRAIRAAVTGGASGGVGGFLNAVVTPPERRKEDGPESWGGWAKRVALSTGLGIGGGAIGNVGSEALGGAAPGVLRRMFAAGVSNAVGGGGAAAVQQAVDSHREKKDFDWDAVWIAATTTGISSALPAGASGAYRTRNPDGTRRMVSLDAHNDRFDRAFEKAGAGRKSVNVREPVPTAEAPKPLPDESGRLDQLQQEARLLDKESATLMKQAAIETETARRDNLKADLYGHRADAEKMQIRARIQQLRFSADEHQNKARQLKNQATETVNKMTRKIAAAQAYAKEGEIANPFGTQKQGSRPQDQTVRAEILEARSQGRPVRLYAIMTTGKSFGLERQFYMYEDPRLPGVAEKYAIPPENLKSPDAVTEVHLRPDAPFVTKKVNDYKYTNQNGNEVVLQGEGVEVVILPSGKENPIFHASAPGEYQEERATEDDIKEYYSSRQQK